MVLGLQGEYLRMSLYKKGLLGVLLWFWKRGPVPCPGLCAVCEEMDAGRIYHGPVVRRKHMGWTDSAVIGRRSLPLPPGREVSVHLRKQASL